MAMKRPLNVQSAKVKLNELFIHWLTLPETQATVGRLGHVSDSGAELLTEADAMAISPVIQLDRAGQEGKDSIYGSLSFTSPPRSPRASPNQHGTRQQQPAPVASPLVDELDLAHRQGAMSPHGSPRGVHHLSPTETGVPNPPTSPLRTKALSLGSPAQAVGVQDSGASAFTGSGSTPTTPTGDVTRLSAAFAQMDTNLPQSASRQSSSATLTSPRVGDQPKRKLTNEPRVAIPRFFFPDGPPLPNDDNEKQLQAAKKLFESKKAVTKAAPAASRLTRKSSIDKGLESKAVNMKAFGELTTKVCLLPRWMNEILFRRVLAYEPGAANYDKEKERALTIHPTNTVVSYPAFKDFYDAEMAGKSKARRLFDAIKWNKKSEHITKADLRPLIDEVLLVHPGLEFLKSTPDFQVRYADTVQIRIVFSCTQRDDDTITWPDFQRSTLCDVLHVLDTESDINVSNKTEYFSYEHFYVLYCKFWELDTDHDFYISQDDLSRYGNNCLTQAIVERIFTGKGRRVRSDREGRMNYEDFVWFCLCEEDKTSLRSLDYWFRCLDTDEDGILSGYELDYFFSEQRQRMEAAYQETISYDDILCQMMDMISPSRTDGLRLSDLKACTLSGNFFNALFNLQKFIAFEQRDPFIAHAEKQLPEKTDWDRFAKVEYDRMSLEAGDQPDECEEYGIGRFDGS